MESLPGLPFNEVEDEDSLLVNFFEDFNQLWVIVSTLHALLERNPSRWCFLLKGVRQNTDFPTQSFLFRFSQRIHFKVLGHWLKGSLFMKFIRDLQRNTSSG